MTTSRIPNLLDGLVTMFTAALPSVQVIDGPYQQAPTGDFLCVGWSPDDDTAATGDQAWAGLGARHKDEQVDVVCYLDAASGSAGQTDVKSRRDSAYVLLAAVEDALRADPQVNGSLTNPGWCGLGPHSLRQEQTESGFEIGITFHIVGQARI